MKVCQSPVGFGGSLRLFNQSSSGLVPGGLEFECDPCVRYIYIFIEYNIYTRIHTHTYHCVDTVICIKL